MRRFWSGRSSKPRITQEQQEQELLEFILRERENDVDEDFVELLRVIQTYSAPVIASCHDAMGNTVLQIVLSHSRRRRRRGSVRGLHPEAIVAAENAQAPKVSRWRRRGAAPAQQPPDETHGDNTNNAFVRLLHYLVHCTDDRSDDDKTNAVRDNPTTCHYNSLVRITCAGGSLPLHTACRCLCGEPHQLDTVEYLLQAFPTSVQRIDAWRNLPLHEACDVASASVPIEVILTLVQRYPEAIRMSNADGDLPLHLAAAAAAVMPADQYGTPRQDCIEEYSFECDSALAIGNIESTLTSEHPEQPTVDQIESTKAVKAGTVLIEERLQLERQQQQQLEIVQYLVDYWPDAVRHTNQHGQTPLQRAMEAPRTSNPAVIQFLQTLVETPPPLIPFSSSSSSSNPFDDDEDFDVPCDAPCSTNPFDDESEPILDSSSAMTNPFDRDSSERREHQVDLPDGQTASCESEGEEIEQSPKAQLEEAPQTDVVIDHATEDASLRDPSVDDCGSSQSSDATGCSVGVELVGDFRIVAEVPYLYSERTTDDAPSAFETRTLEDADEPVTETSTNFPFHHNSMSTIG